MRPFKLRSPMPEAVKLPTTAIEQPSAAVIAAGVRAMHRTLRGMPREYPTVDDNIVAAGMNARLRSQTARAVYRAMLRQSVDDDVKRAFLGARIGRGVRLTDEVRAPGWLGLTMPEQQAAKRFLENALDRYPATSLEELVWCLAVDGSRPKIRGPRPRWSGRDGVRLVDAIETELRAQGKKRRGKAVLNAAAAVRAAAPEIYGRWSAERLCAAYYEARPVHSAIAGKPVQLDRVMSAGERSGNSSK